MIYSRWKPIIPVLNEFKSHLASHVPEFQIEEATDREWSDARYQEQRRKGIFRGYGVYLIFDSDELLRYVGVAMDSFNERIWDSRHEPYRRWTDVISFPHRYYWLAPALEFLLIVLLHPPENRTYCSGYTIQGYPPTSP
jgi:hypothetical protein